MKLSNVKFGETTIRLFVIALEILARENYSAKTAQSLELDDPFKPFLSKVYLNT